MLEGPKELVEINPTPEGLRIGLMDGTAYSAAFTFPVPMKSRTCIDGRQGRAYPDVVVADPQGKAIHWHVGGRAQLPAIVNATVAEHFGKLVASEHAAAVRLRLEPVPEAVVEQFRGIDPDATVAEIRLADRARTSLIADLGIGSRSTALWIARNFVSNEDHQEAVADLEYEVSRQRDKVSELQDTAGRLADCSCEKDMKESARATALEEAVELLRTHGAKVLEFRAGRDDVEKVIDLLDAA